MTYIYLYIYTSLSLSLSPSLSLYVRIYIYMYICVYVYIHIYIYICMISLRFCVYIYIYVVRETERGRDCMIAYWLPIDCISACLGLQDLRPKGCLHARVVQGGLWRLGILWSTAGHRTGVGTQHSTAGHTMIYTGSR